MKKLNVPNIVIFVDGGNVQAVYCSHSAAVDVVDFDNLREEGKDFGERYAILEETKKTNQATKTIY